MIFGVTPITIGDMCGMIAEQAGKWSGLPSEYVFWTVASEDWLLKCPPADFFITLHAESFPVWQSVVTGAGNSTFTDPDFENLGFDMTVRFTSYTRLNLDQEFKSGQLMTNQAIGIMTKVLPLIGALQIWAAPDPSVDPEDEQVSFLREPARIIDGPKVQTRNYHETLWASVTMRFQFRFTCKISTQLTNPT